MLVTSGKSTLNPFATTGVVNAPYAGHAIFENFTAIFGVWSWSITFSIDKILDKFGQFSPS